MCSSDQEKKKSNPVLFPLWGERRGAVTTRVTTHLGVAPFPSPSVRVCPSSQDVSSTWFRHRRSGPRRLQSQLCWCVQASCVSVLAWISPSRAGQHPTPSGKVPALVDFVRYPCLLHVAHLVPGCTHRLGGHVPERPSEA